MKLKLPLELPKTSDIHTSPEKPRKGMRSHLFLGVGSVIIV
jgi:hypothetical protein